MWGDGWLWNHPRPSPLLPPRVQVTLGESPDPTVPRGFQTSHRATPHPYLRNGPHGEGAHVSAFFRSPAQEAVLSSDFPTPICTLNLH